LLTSDHGPHGLHGRRPASPQRSGGTRRVAIILALLAAVLPAALPGRLHAEASGALRGAVVDSAGAPLAGVSAEVTNPAGGLTPRGAVTGADGTFRIAGLPAAENYSVRLSLPGHATVVLSDVSVRAGETTRVDVTLSSEKALRESVQVRASPQIVSLEDTTTQSRFSAEFVDNLPILGRNYQDVLVLAPGVSDVDGDGNPNIHGARDTDVITLVDGVSTTDPLTGKIGAQLNIESIQEIEVKSSGATAEFGRAQGGFANIVTKSGGNGFEGVFKFYWRGAALDGDGAGIDDSSIHGGLGEQGLRDLNFNDFLPFLALSGPIVRDHAWYYAALEYIAKDEPVNALNLAFVTGLREFRAFAKATWQVRPSTRLSLTLNYDPQRFLNVGLNGLTLEETGYTVREGGTNVTLRSVGVLSPDVVLEAAVAHFDSRPSTDPNLGLDTNGNAVVYIDRNHDGFLSPEERDPGEDWDADGAWDIWEDTIIPNGRIDEIEVPDPANGPQATKLVSEDADRDGHLTARGGCEGANREDTDCDGYLDNVDEDINHNGILDGNEDIDKDGRLDRGTEDRNGDGILNDTPFPTSTYPYGRLRPPEADRDYFIDERSGVVSGPFYETYHDQRKRDTVRADLGVFVADFRGTHDIKTGVVLEREAFDRTLDRNDIVALQPPVAPVCDLEEGCLGGRPESLVYLIPSDRSVNAEAQSQSGGIYVQDLYKPMPNLSFGLGLRFDREVVRAPGYTFFDPHQERAAFDRLMAMSGGEIGRPDLISGNRDGLENRGITADPLFLGATDPVKAMSAWVEPLRQQAIRRLTRHRSGLGFTLSSLSGLYNIFTNGEVDPAILSELGVSVQQPEEIAITNNNLSPRLSVAWDPQATGRGKVFATWGRYYDKLFLSSVTGEQGPDTLARYYLIDTDGIDTTTVNGLTTAVPNHHVGGLMSKAPPSVQQVDRSLRTPYSDEWTIGFERELAPEVALSVRAIHRTFRDQLQDVDINHEVRIDPATGGYLDVLGVLLLIPPPPRSGGGPSEVRLPDGRPDLFINNFFFNQVLRVGNYNQAEYNAIEIEVKRRLARRWELQGSYVYSRAQGQAEDFQSRAGNDPSVIESEYGYLDFDQRHVIKVNLGMFLPGDWQAGFVTSWASGLPYSVISRFFSVDSSNYPQFRTRYGYTAVENGSQVFVTLPRNSERNNSVLDINLSTRKNFVIGKSTAAVSLEVFNLLNSDDLHINTYEPEKGDGFDINASRSAAGPLELDATRRFGRRWQIGFQIAF